MSPLVGCIQITDLRDHDVPELPVGQVDAGQSDDVPVGPDLPPAPACADNSVCQTWVNGLPCLTSRCVDSRCVADPTLDGAPCSDRDFRTRDDRCQAGRCVPGAPVCVCDPNLPGACDTFDDGNPCNGRLACDGCSCVPMPTPVGTPCDDLNAATTGDQCLDSVTCAGTVPCQCESRQDCPKIACQEAVCVDCQCRVFPAVAGLIYQSQDFNGGVPSSWEVTTTNDAVAWRGLNGAAQSAGTDGTYDHGATTTVLTSPPLTLPPGHAVLRARVGLLSAEAGCTDRLEIRVGDILLASLCGPTEPHLQTWAVPPDGARQLTATFISDPLSNAGAGAILDDIAWIRTEPDECTAPPAWEVSVPNPAAGEQRHPALAARADGTYLVAWTGPEGVVSRALDAAGLPAAKSTVLDPAGDQISLAGAFGTWRRGSKLVVWDGADTQLIGEPDPIRRPVIDATGQSLAYLADTATGPVLRLRVRPFSTAQTLAGPDPNLQAPHITAGPQGATVITSGSEGVHLFGPNAPDPVVVDPQPSTSRPDLGAGFNRVVAVWTRADALAISSESGLITVPATHPLDPAIAADSAGWIVAWTQASTDDTGLMAVRLTPDAALASPLALPVNEYTFGDQDQLRLAPQIDSALAVWRTDWLDGDASGIVVRRVDPTLLVETP